MDEIIKKCEEVAAKVEELQKTFIAKYMQKKNIKTGQRQKDGTITLTKQKEEKKEKKENEPYKNSGKEDNDKQQLKQQQQQEEAATLNITNTQDIKQILERLSSFDGSAAVVVGFSFFTSFVYMFFVIYA